MEHIIRCEIYGLMEPEAKFQANVSHEENEKDTKKKTCSPLNSRIQILTPPPIHCTKHIRAVRYIFQSFGARVWYSCCALYFCLIYTWRCDGCTHANTTNPFNCPFSLRSFFLHFACRLYYLLQYYVSLIEFPYSTYLFVVCSWLREWKKRRKKPTHTLFAFNLRSCIWFQWAQQSTALFCLCEHKHIMNLIAVQWWRLDCLEFGKLSSKNENLNSEEENPNLIQN